jgi:hypothetical protein
MTETPETPGAPETPVGPGGTQPPAPPPPPAPPVASGFDDYPLQADVEHQGEYNRWLPLVKWFLLIPHYIVLIVLGIIAMFVTFISFFAVIITGRYPRGMFDFMVGVHRWAWRVQSYLLLMTDRYPPFTLDDDPDYPAHFEIDYPEEGTARWRPLVAWFLIIPYFIAAYIIFYLAEILVFFAFFTILFAKKYPEGMFDIVVIAMRWQAKANAYLYWLTTKYPAFAWE